MKINKSTAISIIMLSIGMFLLAYAAVPLYNLFCKATGFGGTTRVSRETSTYIGENTIKIRFDGNVSPELPWKFLPLNKEVLIKTGENTIIFYEAENLSNEPIIGTAVYNVTPNEAGEFFVKIECFCFQEQILKPHEKITMPVLFYIDPAIENDKNTREIKTITLSYSFFRVKK